MLVGLIAMALYDIKWMLLPDRIMKPLYFISAAMALLSIAISSHPLTAVINLILSVAVGGGIFYILYQVSDGKWIGGGDIKLGWVIGLFLGTPMRSFLMIFLASFLGCLVSIPLLISHKLKKDSVIPFGPFLIASAIIVELYGVNILNWYQTIFIK